LRAILGYAAQTSQREPHHRSGSACIAEAWRFNPAAAQQKKGAKETVCVLLLQEAQERVKSARGSTAARGGAALAEGVV